jgi:hypothetical protein
MLVGVVAIALSLSGCIVIPVAPFYDDPLPKKTIQTLTTGVSKEAVSKLLGPPHAIREGGRFWYYGANRPALLAGTPLGYGAGGVFEDYKWAEVEFDEASRLLRAEHQESKTGCASSGNCLLSRGSGSRKMSESAIIATCPAQDDKAKQFLPPAGGCALYVYYDPRTLEYRTPISVRIENATHWINPETYTRFEVWPGDVQILFGIEAVLKDGYTWHCDTDKVAFIHLFGRWDREGTALPNFIESVDETIGKQAILKRRLLLAP